MTTEEILREKIREIYERAKAEVQPYMDALDDAIVQARAIASSMRFLRR